MRKSMLRALWKKHLVLCIAMSLVTAISVGLLIGASSFSDSLGDGLYKYLDDYGFADVTISLNAAYRSTKDELAQISGVEDVNARVFLDTSIKKADGTNVAVRAISYNSNDFSKFHFWSQEGSGYYLDYQFAARNNISAGDTISVLLGTEYREITVNGIISTPETLGLYRLDDWAATPSMGYLYFNESVLSRTIYSVLCNQFLIKVSDDASADDVLNQARALLEGQELTVTEAYTMEQSSSNEVIRDNIDPLASICTLVPSIFFLIVLMVLILCMSILVRHSRREIGTLRALGYSKKDLIQIFCILMLSIAAIGFILGLPLSALLLKILMNFYQAFFPVPSLPLSFNVMSVIVSIVAVSACSVITAFAGSAFTASIHPTEAMQKAAPDNHKSLEWLHKLLPNAKPIIKFNLTTLFRSPGRLVFTIICLAATVVMIFVSLSYKSSCDYFVTELFEQRIHFDYLAYFTENPTEEIRETIAKTEGVTAAEPCSYVDTEISFNGSSVAATIIAAPEGTKLMSFPDAEAVPKEGIVLERYVAETLGVKEGDSVNVNGVDMKVEGISFQVTSRMQCISLAQAEALETPDYGALMICADNAETLQSVLSQTKGFLYLASVDSMETEVDEDFESFTFIIKIIIACAMALGFIIVLITTRATLSERQREICIMRSQGFSFGTISFSWLLQSGLQFAAGCIIGLPIGAYAAKTVLNLIKSVRRAFRYTSDWHEFLLTIILLIIYLLVAHWIALRIVKNWNLAEKTKSGE